MIIKNVLVVCVGNICRSPMAEALMRNALKDRPDICVSSAGIAALVGEPADKLTMALMQDRSLDVSGHRARQLNEELIDTADLILVMETGHKHAIDLQDPAARGKVHRLCEVQGKDIPDPYRQPRKAFEDALVLIEAGVQDWAEKIKQSEARRA